MSYQPGIDTELLRTFVAIAEHGGFTRAAEALNRTQSAVSMQMKRLEEDVLQRSLFERDGRQTRLTAEGQVLLGYARRILKLHGEVFNTLRRPHMVGSVRIGTPDDYVMRFLPAILSRFAEAYPLVQVEVHCDTSLNLLARNDLDPFVWMAAEGFCPHDQRPIPLAMFNTTCFCRAWACNALEAAELDYRIAYSSPSLSALFAVVSAGLAVTVQLRSLLTGNLRILDESEGLPALPSASIMLMRNPHSQSPVTEKLAEYIGEGFRL